MRFFTLLAVFFAVAQLANASFPIRIPLGCVYQQCLRPAYGQQSTCAPGYTHFKNKRCGYRKKQEICCPAAPGHPGQQETDY